MAKSMNFAVLRVIDANANRAREALRVVEDYARFVLNDGGLCGELKVLRHELAGVMGALQSEGVLHRDTAGDVGTENTTSSEMMRSNVGSVVTAAGKRFGEAVRVMEEFAKIGDPPAAAGLERIRYRFYELEMRVARTIRPGGFEKVRLCVLVTEGSCKKPWREAAEGAIRGGADCLQLREKELEGGELLRRAKDFVKLCREHGVVSIINDRADVAVLADADGVHVGQGDLPAVEARRVVGSGKLVGVSTHEMGQARQAVLDGADYIGVGPVFRSGTKPREIMPGVAYAREVAGGIGIPGVAIGGITEGNADEVIATGISGIAVTAAVVGCEDVEGAARRLKKKFEDRR